jgi:hypothetical protein
MIVALMLIGVGLAAGIAGTLTVAALIGWNRHRQLKELLDWLGEDLEARKMVMLRTEQRRAYMRGELP